MKKNFEEIEALFDEFDSQFTEELDDSAMFTTSGSCGSQSYSWRRSGRA